jgi:hypothetical protein
MYGFYLIQANFSAKIFKEIFVQSLEKQRKSVYARELDWIKIFLEKYIKNVLNKYVFGIYGYICAVI